MLQSSLEHNDREYWQLRMLSAQKSKANLGFSSFMPFTLLQEDNSYFQYICKLKIIFETRLYSKSSRRFVFVPLYFPQKSLLYCFLGEGSVITVVISILVCVLLYTEVCQLESGTQNIRESLWFSCSFQFLFLLVSRYPSFLDFQISQTQERIFRLLIDMIGHKFYVLKLMSMPVRFQEMVLLPLCFEESPWSPMSNKIHQLQSSKFCLYQLYQAHLREFCSFPFLYSKLQFFF